MQLIKNLAVLDISSTNVHKQEVSALARLPLLTFFVAKNNGLTDDDVLSLAHSRSIKTLLLGHNNLSDQGVAAIIQNLNLYNLDLMYNNIHDKGAYQLANTTTISRLNVAYNHIGTNGIDALKSNKYFEVLVLDGNDGFCQANMRTHSRHINDFAFIHYCHLSKANGKWLAEKSLRFMNNK